MATYAMIRLRMSVRLESEGFVHRWIVINFYHLGHYLVHAL